MYVMYVMIRTKDMYICMCALCTYVYAMLCMHVVGARMYLCYVFTFAMLCYVICICQFMYACYAMYDRLCYAMLCYVYVMCVCMYACVLCCVCIYVCYVCMRFMCCM